MSSNQNNDVFESILAICKSYCTAAESTLIDRLKAIIDKDPSAARLAIVNGRDHSRFGRGMTLLHHAADRRSPEFCQVLVEMDIGLETVRATDRFGNTPLHCACRGSYHTAKYLYGLYPESIDTGYYPLHILLDSGDYKPKQFKEVLRFLLTHDKGAVFQADEDGNLPLHAAVKNCRSTGWTIVELVYNANPDAIFIRNNDGRTPLDVARYVYKQDVIAFFEAQLPFVRRAHEELLPNDNGQYLIHRALEIPAVAVGTIKLIVAANPQMLRMTDNQGRTPMHIACEVGKLDVVKFFVEADVSLLKINDSNGNLPIHLACRSGNCNVVSYILEKSTHGASIKNGKRGDGKLPLQLLLFGAGFDEEKRHSLEYVDAVDSLVRAHPAWMAWNDEQ
jgi:ankyrin repeat protein